MKLPESAVGRELLMYEGLRARLLRQPWTNRELWDKSIAFCDRKIAELEKVERAELIAWFEHEEARCPTTRS